MRAIVEHDHTPATVVAGAGFEILRHPSDLVSVMAHKIFYNKASIGAASENESFARSCRGGNRRFDQAVDLSLGKVE